MANIYKNALVAIDTTNQKTLYAAPLGTTSIIKYINVANTTAAASTITLTIRKGSNAALFPVVLTVAVSPFANLALTGSNSIVLESTDSILVLAAHVDRLVVVASILEIT